MRADGRDKTIRASLIAGIAAGLLIASCAHPPRDHVDQPDRLSVSLEQVSLLDALRFCPVRVNPVSNGPWFTTDSIPRSEMENTRVSVAVTDVTPEDYIQEVARAAQLKIEIKAPGLFRVTRPKK